MDPTFGWTQPEQQGPALQLWQRIMDGLTENQDYIPLTTGSSPSLESKYPTTYGGFPPPSLGGYPAEAPFSRYGGTPWIKPDRVYSDGIIKLHEEIEDFYEFIQPTEVEHEVRRFVLQLIKDVISDLWPQAECKVFGSYFTGLYLPKSDVDLVVLGQWEATPFATLTKALIQNNIANASDIRVLDKAAVPLVKFTEKTTGIKVDISFNQPNSVEAGKLIKNFCVTFPHLPKLLFVLKQYLQQRGLNEVFTGGISSYSLILLIVSFFQLHSRPAEVRSNDGSVNLGTLLLEFLELYGRFFNFDIVGICIKGSGSLVEKSKLNLTTKPKEGGLCIEDPLTEGNDVGGKSYGMPTVKRSFDAAFATLERAVHPSSKRIIDSKKSILGRIIRISDDVLEERKRMQRVYQDLRTLHGRGPPPTPLGHHHGRHHYHGNNLNNNNNNNNNNLNHHRYLNGSGGLVGCDGRTDRSLSVHTSSGIGQSCSSSLSSVGSDKGSWHDEEDLRGRDSEEREDDCDSRSDIEPDSSSDYDEAGGHHAVAGGGGTTQHCGQQAVLHSRHPQHHQNQQPLQQQQQQQQLQQQQQPQLMYAKINNLNSNGAVHHHPTHHNNNHHHNASSNRDQQLSQQHPQHVHHHNSNNAGLIMAAGAGPQQVHTAALPHTMSSGGRRPRNIIHGAGSAGGRSSRRT